MYGTTRMHNGDVENPEKGLQNSIERDGGDGKSMQIVVRRNVEAQGKSEDEKGRKDKMKIRKFEEIWTSVEMERVAKATERRWPKEKELLDKGDGLATAAGARRNNESRYVHIHESSLIRLTVVFRRT